MPVDDAGALLLSVPNPPDDPESLVLSFISADLLPKPPNENPPEPMLLDPNALPLEDVVSVVVGNALPNEKPPAPILPAADDGCAAEDLDDDLPSSPGFTVSQATQVVDDALLDTIHTAHFHEPSSDALNMEPHPSDSPVCFLSVEAAGSSSLSSSSSSSSPSSLSPSPNNQSTYHDTNASFVMTFSPASPSKVLIFLIVRRCSSSQYVVPSDSISLPKSEAGILLDPSLTPSNAFSALAFSSAISLS